MCLCSLHLRICSCICLPSLSARVSTTSNRIPPSLLRLRCLSCNLSYMNCRSLQLIAQQLWLYCHQEESKWLHVLALFVSSKGVALVKYNDPFEAHASKISLNPYFFTSRVIHMIWIYFISIFFLYIPPAFHSLKGYKAWVPWDSGDCCVQYKHEGPILKLR